jgi:hypothetical protein
MVPYFGHLLASAMGPYWDERAALTEVLFNEHVQPVIKDLRLPCVGEDIIRYASRMRSYRQSGLKDRRWE